ncbi:fumarylacetoacetate hydrolase family protein [Aurantiacibacter poecillastricola]|uniref:fumarylacetoacetate hydrolase family protein n=1 Tax=Aurantiacibacter poecillastricola TaxID=3064385 RepID=UPI00273F9862|nr:fumarylacetoacetate hydrolase family protein [Aurantiacibacter sp. 219JJ12-13]MDP5261283.1 fumarylacetoacetate hydrolase family protein [Aurantiacibacter sp. 219JJ12-13]
MRLATRDNGSPDGELVVVSEDGTRGVPAGPNWPCLRIALENWDEASVDLAGFDAEKGEPLHMPSVRAPLPRAWQWLDGSAFQTHADLMQVAFNTDPIENDMPLMYQGMSDRFYGPFDDVPFPDETMGIDFEGEFGVIVDAVPMGTTAAEALQHIKLIVQINDWSLRAIAPVEMKTGFGWIVAKPACSVAPFAVSPDELGEGWQDGRVCLDLAVDWNGERFGNANGREMAFGFHQLVAHAARSRDLAAGTIIGSGTVANANYGTVGSSCISERRAIEIIAGGKPDTGFMKFGDTVRMEARDAQGRSPFGLIEQTVVQRAPPGRG